MAVQTGKLFWMKIATIIIGIVCAVFIALESFYSRGYFFIITIIAIVLSVVLLLLIVLGALDQCRPDLWDGITHLVLAILLLIGVIVYAIRPWHYHHDDTEYLIFRIIAVILGCVNVILYFIIGLSSLGAMKV